MSQIEERNSSVSKEILVNLGNKDALEFSKGNTQFNPEQTINNIKKISDLAKSKGVVVKFSPIPKLLSSQEGVDNEKYNSFAKQINGHMQGDQKTTTPDPSQTLSVAPVAQGAPVVKKKETEAEAETEADEEEEEKPVSMPPAEAAAKFEKRTNEIDSLDLKTLFQKHIEQTESEKETKLLNKENSWHKIFTD